MSEFLCLECGTRYESLEAYCAHKKTHNIGLALGDPRPVPDPVNHPSHYTKGKFETIDVIEDIIQHYSGSAPIYCVGQILRYISRAPLKGNIKEDLLKAQWYMNRLVKLHE